MAQRFHVMTGSGGPVLPVTDGDYFTEEMPANYQSGQCYIECVIFDYDVPTTIYFSGSNTSPTAKVHEITMSSVSPIPVDQTVNMGITFARTAGGFSGVSDSAMQIEYSRV